jgi:hypothetical protein
MNIRTRFSQQLKRTLDIRVCCVFVALSSLLYLSLSYVTTDGQSTNLSSNRAPIRGLRQDFYYCQSVAGLLILALSLTRGRICPLQLLLALTSAVILCSESRGTRDHILLSQIWDFPFRRLVRLAGLRWRYSNPPPHWWLSLKNWLSSKHHRYNISTWATQKSEFYFCGRYLTMTVIYRVIA